MVTTRIKKVYTMKSRYLNSWRLEFFSNKNLISVIYFETRRMAREAAARARANMPRINTVEVPGEGLGLEPQEPSSPLGSNDGS